MPKAKNVYRAAIVFAVASILYNMYHLFLAPSISIVCIWLHLRRMQRPSDQRGSLLLLALSPSPSYSFCTPHVRVLPFRSRADIRWLNKMRMEQGLTTTYVFFRQLTWKKRSPMKHFHNAYTFGNTFLVLYVPVIRHVAKKLSPREFSELIQYRAHFRVYSRRKGEVFSLLSFLSLSLVEIRTTIQIKLKKCVLNFNSSSGRPPIHFMISTFWKKLLFAIHESREYIEKRY